MIIDILHKNYDSLFVQLTIVMIVWLLVILSNGIDLYFGIKKSKESGVYTHSYGLRKTSEKVVQYLAFMFFMLFIDVLNPIWVYFDLVQLPLLTIFGGIVLIYTEWKSVKEKTDEKFRYAIKNNTADIIKFLQENKDFVEKLSEIENNKKDE